MEGLLGDDCLFQNSDGHFFVGNTRWHSDGSVPGYPFAHIALYLDPVDAHTGALRVIAGSHHREFHELIASAMRTGLYSNLTPDLPGTTILESTPGDALVFNHSLWHSAWGGRDGRRMFSLNFGANPTQDFHTLYIRGIMAASVPVSKGKRLYSDRLVETAGPRRMNKLRKCIEMGFNDPKLPPQDEVYALFARRRNQRTLGLRTIAEGR